uniref:OPT family oligopeptide transporter n=1 Tax=uncultured marine group II/III euryarchaeote KM3_190_A04 TaxID=1457959 RepID=A0A075GWI2_9EURY|nr:OPT family oligopeptide transporter [uncultured marine group II/III euryarchaeote KM3_190_A04]
MSGVKRSAYRQPVTPSGLEAIEKGTLSWLDEDMYNNLNTGVLEQYLEEKNLNESFEVSHWDTKKVLIGILIGAVFSGVTAYIGLKIGLAVSAAWYVAYLTGMALQWSPSEVNISTSATTGATHASTGFIFTFPAIFLLAYSEDYKLGDVFLITSVDTFQIAFIGIIASMFAGFLGVMYFIIFRRVWLVEDPLPMPGFEATLKMLDISSDVSTGAADAARESLKTVGIWTVFTMVFMFIIDYPIKWSNKVANIPSSLADWLAMTLSGDDWGAASIYTERWLHQPSQLSDGHAIANGITLYEPGNPFSYTFLGIELSPTLLAIGWFMKFRVAFLVNLGSIVAWFYLIPLAVAMDVPVYDPSAPMPGGEFGGYVKVTEYPAAQWKAFASIVRTVAIGSILGGGIIGLLKMAPTFKGIFGDIARAFTGEQGEEFIEGRGWYEWPLSHIPIFMLIAFGAMILIFVLGGFPVLPSLIFGVILLSTTFLLGAIAVRVMGETGIEPVSGTSFIVLLMLLLIFLNVDVGLNKEESVMIALVGTTVFGSAISMSGTVVGDYKNSLYIGTRPYHISKGNIMGVVPGAILGAAVAIGLSKLLADGSIDLQAPQANAFATFTLILAEGQGNWTALGLGFLLGAFVEWATGMGTSFGLGMYLPTPITFPMLIGGAGRDWWEKKKLAPKVAAIRALEGAGAAEKKRALMLLFTFMIAAGALTGEAFYGVEAAILAALDESKIGTIDNWPTIRFAGFLILNLLLGLIIYALFRQAGILGSSGDGDSDSGADVLDAELS